MEREETLADSFFFVVGGNKLWKQSLLRRICDEECCGGRSEPLVCGVSSRRGYGVQLRARRVPHTLCSLNSVVSLRRVMCGVAAALWRRVPHSGGLLGVMRSVYFGPQLSRGHRGLKSELLVGATL
jgi:hypothetical protein